MIMGMSSSELFKFVSVSIYTIICLALLIKNISYGTKLWIILLTPIYPILVMLYSLIVSFLTYAQGEKKNTANFLKYFYMAFILYPIASAFFHRLLLMFSVFKAYRLLLLYSFKGILGLLVSEQETNLFKKEAQKGLYRTSQ